MNKATRETAQQAKARAAKPWCLETAEFDAQNLQGAGADNQLPQACLWP